MAEGAAAVRQPSKREVAAAVALGGALCCTSAGHFALLLGLGLLYPLHAGVRGLRQGEERQWLAYWLMVAVLLWARGLVRGVSCLPALDGLPEALLLAGLYTPPINGLDVVMEVVLLPMVHMMALNREKQPTLDLPSRPATPLPAHPPSPASPGATPPRSAPASFRRAQRSEPSAP